MSVIGEFTVPASALAMEETLGATPDMSAEIERVVAHESGLLTPYFWISGGDRERFETVLNHDPSVQEATRLDVHQNTTLYRAEWPPNVESVGHAYLQTGATILEATGRADAWELRLRFDDQEDVGTFSDYCEDHDIPFQLNRLYNPTTAKAGGQFGVTPKQREALIAALDSGFYEIPQHATMAEIADTIEISQQALSKRLRRAHGNLVSNVLTVEELTDEE